MWCMVGVSVSLLFIDQIWKRGECNTGSLNYTTCILPFHLRSPHSLSSSDLTSIFHCQLAFPNSLHTSGFRTIRWSTALVPSRLQVTVGHAIPTMALM